MTHQVALVVVSSYLAFSPLPQLCGGYFLLHFPLDYSSHLLDGILSLCSSDFPLFAKQPPATPTYENNFS